MDSNDITSVIFDFDGTLIDSIQGVKYSFGKAIECVIPSMTIPDDLHSRIGPAVREVFRGCFDDLPGEKLDDLVIQFRKHYDSEGYYRVTTYPGVEQALSNLVRNNISCYLATNKPKLPTSKILQYLGIEHYFSSTVSSDTRNPPYPSKSQMVSALMETNCIDVSQTVFVGDTIEDAQTAFECGLLFFATTYGYGFNHGKSHSDFPIHKWINSISELVTTVIKS